MVSKGTSAFAEDLKDTLRNLRGEWQIQLDKEGAENARWGVYYTAAQNQHNRILEPILAEKKRISAEITKLEKAVAALGGSFATEAEIRQVTGTSVGFIPVDKAKPQYNEAFLVRWEGYDIFAVRVKPGNKKAQFIVLKCACESYRFTKGELQSGKTCKHIRNFLAAYPQTKDAKARIALRRAGFRGIQNQTIKVSA